MIFYYHLFIGEVRTIRNETTYPIHGKYPLNLKRCLFSIVYMLRRLPQRGLSAAIRLLGRPAALLRKNWQQVKHSDAIFAVSTIANDDTVNGGTGWAVQMAIDNTNDVVDIMTRFKSQLHIDAVSPL